jgi:hypothetical protein
MNQFHIKNIEEIRNVLFNLENNVARLDYEGYDPYDIKGHPFFMWAIGLPRTPFFLNILRKVILGPLVIGESLFPRFSRFLFNVKPTRNAKGIALFAKGYLNLYRISGEKVWLDKALKLSEWLLENRSEGYKYYCWGYPFAWNNSSKLPAFTPAVVVTAAVFDVLWHLGIETKEEKYFTICASITNFFIEDLNKTVIDENTLCFSYTPLDSLMVHNVNLMVADCLLQIGFKNSNAEIIDIGLKAANYALKEQNKDGSLYYHGSALNHLDPNRIDHYHSGFEIRSLIKIWLSTSDQRFFEAAKSYYNFYLNNLVNYDIEKVLPNMYPKVLYPIDIHSCAESIILNSIFTNYDQRAISLLSRLLPSVIFKMLRRDGFFKYRITRYRSFKVVSGIPYMRWGQAWMFLSLSEFFVAYQKLKEL